MTKLYRRVVKALLALFATTLALSVLLLVGILKTEILPRSAELVAERLFLSIAIFSGIWVVASAAYLIQGTQDR